MREAIIGARVKAHGLDRAALNALTTVPRVRSVTVTEDSESGTVGAFGFLLPLAFMILLFTSVMGSGQGMLTTTIEEKSSRVIEVLLSAVSPMQLMAGKLLGHMAISLVAMSLYIVLGLVVLASFSMLGLLSFSLVVYLFIFFLLAFFTIGSIMMAVGAAVNDMREAQSLMMPVMMVMMSVWFLWVPVVAQSRLAAGARRELSAARKLLRHAAAARLVASAARVAGVAVDRDRARRRGRRGVVHGEGVSHRASHVRQAAELRDA